MISTGRVAHFDEAAGLGVIDADDGAQHRFHCIAIADGTRTIDVGQRVSFVRATRFGSIEASDIVKV